MRLLGASCAFPYYQVYYQVYLYRIPGYVQVPQKTSLQHVLQRLQALHNALQSVIQVFSFDERMLSNTEEEKHMDTLFTSVHCTILCYNTLHYTKLE